MLDIQSRIIYNYSRKIHMLSVLNNQSIILVIAHPLGHYPLLIVKQPYILVWHEEFYDGKVERSCKRKRLFLSYI